VPSGELTYWGLLLPSTRTTLTACFMKGAEMSSKPGEALMFILVIWSQITACMQFVCIGHLERIRLWHPPRLSHLPESYLRRRVVPAHRDDQVKSRGAWWPCPSRMHMLSSLLNCPNQCFHSLADPAPQFVTAALS